MLGEVKDFKDLKNYSLKSPLIVEFPCPDNSKTLRTLYCSLARSNLKIAP